MKGRYFIIKTNYELKAKMLSSDMLAQYKKAKVYEYYLCNKSKEELLQLPSMFEDAYYLINALKSYNEPQIEEELKECKRICDANKNRKNRLKNKIELYLKQGKCIFVTLTFTDACLEFTSEATRRKYVTRFLKTYSNKYVANIDYGAQFEREHYHALILCDKIKPKSWKYGAINFKKVRVEEACSSRLASYINKLTNHAIKKTTKRSSIIYSKEFIELDPNDIRALRERQAIDIENAIIKLLRSNNNEKK